MSEKTASGFCGSVHTQRPTLSLAIYGTFHHDCSQPQVIALLFFVDPLAIWIYVYHTLAKEPCFPSLPIAVQWHFLTICVCI